MCTPIAPPTSTSTTRTVAAIQTFMERKNIRFIPFAVVVLFFTPLSRNQQKECQRHVFLTVRNHGSPPSRWRTALSVFSDNLSRKHDLNDFSDKRNGRGREKTGEERRAPCLIQARSLPHAGKASCLKNGHSSGSVKTGNAFGRDSIRTKVFEGKGVGFGVGEGNLSPERFPSPSPIFIRYPE